MRLPILLPYIALLAGFVSAGPVGYRQRRHEESPNGGKQLITTVMVFTRTMVLEIDLPPATCTSLSTEPIPPPTTPTAPPQDDPPEVTVTQVVTVTKKKTTTFKQDPVPTTTERLSRLNPLPTTENVDIPATTTCTDTLTTTNPAPDVTEKPPPPLETPTLQPTSTYTLSRLSIPPGRPKRPPRSSTLPVEPTTTEIATTQTTIAETATGVITTEPAPTTTPQSEQTSSVSNAPTTTGFVPPTEPAYDGPFFKENIPLAIKRNQEYNGLKEGDACDPNAYLLACAGTMGATILQCGATKTYEVAFACPLHQVCFATPRLLEPGAGTACDTPENAGKKFGMSPEELLKAIGKGKGKGKEKEKDNEKDKDNKGGYRRKRRWGAGYSPSKRFYR